MTALNVIDHSGLTHFGMDSYANITRLRVENTPNIDTATIVATRGTNLQRLRLVGVNWSLTSETALRALAHSSMAGKAIDANGNNVNDGTVYPTVTGTVTINRIQKSLYDRLHTLYPNLIITATTKYHVVKFYNEGVLHDTQEVNDGENADAPATPTKAATTQYVYSFSGWDASYNAVSQDLTIHAQFGSSIQQYTIKFWEDSTKADLYAQVNNVSFGADYTYPNALPTLSGYVFCGWQDGSGHEYEYITMMPDSSATINEYGVPQDIDLWQSGLRWTCRA